MTTKPKTSQLQTMRRRIQVLDPLSGPNVMRYTQANFKDNGGGTMTFRQPLSYKNNAKVQKT